MPSGTPFQAPPDPKPNPGLVLPHSSSIPAVSTDPQPGSPVHCPGCPRGDPKGCPWPGLPRQEREWGAILSRGYQALGGGHTGAETGLFWDLWDGVLCSAETTWSTLTVLGAGLLGATCGPDRISGRVHPHTELITTTVTL